MRNRAFIPEAPDRLERRAVLSGAQAPAHLTASAYGLNLLLIKGEFEQYATSGDLARLRGQLASRAESVPFGRVDGLGQQVDAILSRMQTDLAAGVPGAIKTAHQEVVAGVRAELIKHIQDGTLVIVK